MGKNKKRKHGAAAAPVQPPAPATTTGDISSERIALCAADVETTIDTLRYLAERPELLEHKALRELRAALHPLVEHQLKKYDPIDYALRVTTAFREGRGADALLALQGLHARSQTVRQGTVQRWVRDCDSITDAGLRVKLLHAVLRAGRASGGGDEPAERGLDEVAKQQEDEDEDEAAHVGEEEAEDEADEQGHHEEEPSQQEPSTESVTTLPPWTPHTSPEDLAAARASAAASAGATANCSSAALLPPELSGATAQQLGVRVVMTERGPERQPPNHHDLHIRVCGEHVRLLEPGAPSTAPRRVDVPGVPGAFVMLDVLSRAECASLSTIAEIMGYAPDHPLSRPTPSGIGACEWLLSTATTETLLRRCRPLLPAELCGGKLAGINARCRFFRYTDSDGAVYRPHIDGSWPGSGLDPSSGRYVHDAYGDRRSRLTFLVYLNDGFDGGCTTFYQPASSGGLRARGVVPRAGSVLCFPQGNTASLLHEGSAVTRGIKDVIRTDVLYYQSPSHH